MRYPDTVSLIDGLKELREWLEGAPAMVTTKDVIDRVDDVLLGPKKVSIVDINDAFHGLMEGEYDRARPEGQAEWLVYNETKRVFVLERTEANYPLLPCCAGLWEVEYR